MSCKLCGFSLLLNNCVSTLKSYLDLLVKLQEKIFLVVVPTSASLETLTHPLDVVTPIPLYKYLSITKQIPLLWGFWKVKQYFKLSLSLLLAFSGASEISITIVSIAQWQVLDSFQSKCFLCI